MTSATQPVARHVVLAAWPLIVAGFGHTLAIIPDHFGSGIFSPTSPGARDAMAESGMVLTDALGADRTLWTGYLGFHASHGVGLGFVGLVNLLLARRDPEILTRVRWWLPLSLAVASVYLVLSLAYWFYVPSLAFAWSVGCFALALRRARTPGAVAG